MEPTGNEEPYATIGEGSEAEIEEEDTVGNLGDEEEGEDEGSGSFKEAAEADENNPEAKSPRHPDLKEQRRPPFILDHHAVCNIIKRGLQAHGFCNRQSKEQIRKSIHGCESIINTVVKAQLGRMIHDLVNLQRSRQQQLHKMQQLMRMLPGEANIYDLISMKD